MRGAGGVDCDFCDVDAFRSAALFLENDACIYASHEVVDDSVLPGSGILVPRAHRESPFDLTEAEWASMRLLLLEARQRTDERFAPDGYNLGWNVRPAAGQEMAHVHLHLIPRFADEPHAGRGIRWWLKQPDNRRPDPAAPGRG